jgi:hypothetical protein
MLPRRTPHQMSGTSIAILAMVWTIHIYLIVRCCRRGRWGYALAGLTVLAPLAWIGAFLEPRHSSEVGRAASSDGPPAA